MQLKKSNRIGLAVLSFLLVGLALALPVAANVHYTATITQNGITILGEGTSTVNVQVPPSTITVTDTSTIHDTTTVVSSTTYTVTLPAVTSTVTHTSTDTTTKTDTSTQTTTEWSTVYWPTITFTIGVTTTTVTAPAVTVTDTQTQTTTVTNTQTNTVTNTAVVVSTVATPRGSFEAYASTPLNVGTSTSWTLVETVGQDAQTVNGVSTVFTFNGNNYFLIVDPSVYPGASAIVLTSASANYTYPMVTTTTPPAGALYNPIFGYYWETYP